jgi:oxygen-independent coproporphyrinogen-3 oxidase
LRRPIRRSTRGEIVARALDSALNTSLGAWRPHGKRLGAYVHLPFCVERCGYCSFNTAPYTPHAMDRFVAALLREIDLASSTSWSRSVALRSVFLGGGTPSLATGDAMAAILEALRSRFALEPEAEITVECNPESVSRDRLAEYRRAGVNRISLGVQSLDDRILPTLDRRHSAEDARQAFDAARTAGFDNISTDLIYGLPGLDTATWETTVSGVIGWKPDHLSAYALALDEGSLWHAAGDKTVPADEEFAAQYQRLISLAREAGYEHYEISNYARSGRRSDHNQIYWRAEEYLGLGPGAAGFLGDVRYANVKPVERYCVLSEAGQLPVGSHETLTPRQRLAERLILGLRTKDGVPASWIEERIAIETGRLPELLESWKERGLLVKENGRAMLTEAGFLLSDALFVALL